jgi:hypothetical protein
MGEYQHAVGDICRTYLAAAELYRQRGTHAVCVDEMAMRALERVVLEDGPRPEKPKRIEYGYKRHGTQCLIGSWDVVEGQLIETTVGPTRKEGDFLRHIQRRIARPGWKMGYRAGPTEYSLQRIAGTVCA